MPKRWRAHTVHFTALVSFIIVIILLKFWNLLFLSKCDYHCRGARREKFRIICSMSMCILQPSTKIRTQIDVTDTNRWWNSMHFIRLACSDASYMCCALCVIWILAFFPFETVPCGNSTERERARIGDSNSMTTATAFTVTRIWTLLNLYVTCGHMTWNLVFALDTDGEPKCFAWHFQPIWDKSYCNARALFYTISRDASFKMDMSWLSS